jgi:hypothetical protein
MYVYLTSICNPSAINQQVETVKSTFCDGIAHATGDGVTGISIADTLTSFYVLVSVHFGDLQSPTITQSERAITFAIMQLVGSKTSQRLEEIGEGSLTLLPTDPEDMVIRLEA